MLLSKLQTNELAKLADIQKAQGENEKLKAEIERLQADNDVYYCKVEMMESKVSSFDEMKTEIKKVREEDKELKKDKDKYFAYLKDKDLECETQRERADYNEKEWLKLKKQVSSIAEEYLSTGDETLDEIREYIEAKTDEVVELKALCLENDIEY